MNIHSFYRPFLEYFRTRRMAEVCKTFQLSDATTILDVGGALYNWTLISVKPRLTILNLFSAPAGLPEGVSWVIGDGTRLPFPDRHFDICYSNSVIEHLCNLEAQKAMADEIRRVAKGYYVQTPNYRFPIEPHFISPFIHWLPVHLRRRMLRNFTVWGWITRPDEATQERLAHEIRLLTVGEMKSLFPDARITVERFWGLPKSIIAMKAVG